MSAGTRTFRHFDRKKPLFSVIGALLVLAAMMGLRQDSPSSPPSGVEGRIIDRVVFEHLRTVNTAYAESIVDIAPGAVWDRAEIAAACARLTATGKFEGTPYAEAREEDGQLVLVFVVHELPFVQGVDFVGNQKFKDRDLLKAIELSVGSPISTYVINQARQDLERKYREAGYSHVAIDVDQDVLLTEDRVLFIISEGPRIKVRHIEFEGNDAFSDRELRSKIETATYIWLFRTGEFADDVAQRDAAAVKKYYTDRGFLNAQVGYRVDFPENESDLTLTFQIEEGLQHIIKTIEFDGNTVFDNDQVSSFMRAAIGLPADADILEEDRKRIVAEYGSIGYIYAEVSTQLLFDEEDGYVNLVVSVREGEQYRVGRIDIRGNRHTKDKVVRRELRFFPEELYDTEEAQRAERRLLETGLFNEVTITPKGDTPGVRSALVDLTEANTTNILFGVGVTSNSGVVGSISIEQKNFDLFDFPRTTKEFFKGRSFKGAGQTMRFSIEPGTDLTRGRIEFREPYLLDKELGFGIGAYLFERGREEYDERRIGFYTSLDKRWQEGLLKGWATELALKFESVKIDGTDMWTATEIQDDAGSSWLTSLKGTLLRDRTDSRWLPSVGNRLKFSWEQFGALGGDHSFSKLLASYDHYWTVKRDSFDRKHIFQVGASAGQILGDAPVFEKFYAGGIGSLRGFEFRGISPRAGWRSDRVGGDFMLLTNAQYSFPLIGKTVRGVTFLDMGTVEEDFGLNSWRASVGFGARVYVQFFGPIPLAFDFAVPIAEDSDDDTQIFSFSFGTTF
ncbi:MAG: outer membrane protein assembly factor BamA [Planctomycetota bacterium]